jgi:DNA-3-methyladenine glycosylase II
MRNNAVDRRSTVVRTEHEWSVAIPYRLDLTVSVLRRLSSNLIDVLTPNGEYLRALGGARTLVVARVTQPDPVTLAISLEGDECEHSRALAIVRRVLGVDRDLAHFDRAAARISWLKSLAQRMRGVRPPRYPTLWEACVNAVVFQQLSLIAATAIMRRLIVALGQSLVSDDFRHYSFPSMKSFLDADDDLLRAAGLSAGKLMTLRRVGEALAGGTIDETQLEQQTSADAAAILCRIKGIGPWTAAVILLRGLGRLDVFPMNDTSVTRNLALVSGSTAVDVERTLRALSPQQGMLYYHLLLARLEAQQDLGRPSDSARDTPASHRPCDDR